MYFLLFVFLLLSVSAMYQKHSHESSSSDACKKGMLFHYLLSSHPPYHILLHSFMITLLADSHLSYLQEILES